MHLQGDKRPIKHVQGSARPAHAMIHGHVVHTHYKALAWLDMSA